MKQLIQYDKVVVKKPEDLVFPFEHSGPYFKCEYVAGYYHLTALADPFPCNGKHDENLVRKEVERIENRFPIGAITRYIILPFEIQGRTNAMAYDNEISWGALEKKVSSEKEARVIQERHKLECTVIMSAKRTIILPEMTTYLVSHEYGHFVDYWITKLMNDEARKKDEKVDDNIFRKQYAKMRDLDWDKLDHSYGGGRWAGSIGEIIAEDFRLVMSGRNANFYSQPVEYPLGNKDVIKFWFEMNEKYGIGYERQVEEEDSVSSNESEEKRTSDL